MRRDYRDAKPHKLVIELVDGVVEYELVHNEDCGTEVIQQGLACDGPIEVFTCLVQSVLDDGGLHEEMGFDPNDPFMLEPGTYLLVGCSTYDDYTHESEIWIEPYRTDKWCKEGT